VLLNVHKPRHRAHFERFGCFHETFYRSVEATSVTPWAARALDRGLAAILVAAVRHLDPSLSLEDAAGHFQSSSPVRSIAFDFIEHRARRIVSKEDAAALRRNLERLADTWAATADDLTRNGGRFSYTKRSQNGLLKDPLDPDLASLNRDRQAFVAGRSMRDVEPVIGLDLCGPDGRPIIPRDTPQ